MKVKRHTGIHNTLICRTGRDNVMGKGVENKEHGIIYNEQYKHGGRMENMENSFNHRYNYSSKIELAQEV